MMNGKRPMVNDKRQMIIDSQTIANVNSFLSQPSWRLRRHTTPSDGITAVVVTTVATHMVKRRVIVNEQ